MPVRTSHRRMLLSSEPEARMLLSGDQEMVDTLEGVLEGARLRVPDLDGAVGGGGGNPAAVGGEFHGRDALLVAAEDHGLLVVELGRLGGGRCRMFGGGP